MKLVSFLFLFLSLHSFIYAQPQPGNNAVTQSSYISARANKPVLFSYSTARDYLNIKTIDNAFELQIASDEVPHNVFANIVFQDPLQNDVFANKIALKLANHSSYNASITNNTTYLHGRPMLLFYQPSVANAQHFSFFYDLSIEPITTFVSSGNYNFSIYFTITQP